MMTLIIHIAATIGTLVALVWILQRVYKEGYNLGFSRGAEMGRNLERSFQGKRARAARIKALKAPDSKEMIKLDTALSIYDEFKEKLERSAMELYLDTRKKFVNAEKEATK